MISISQSGAILHPFFGLSKFLREIIFFWLVFSKLQYFINIFIVDVLTLPKLSVYLYIKLQKQQ